MENDRGPVAGQTAVAWQTGMSPNSLVMSALFGSLQFTAVFMSFSSVLSFTHWAAPAGHTNSCSLESLG